MVIINAKIVLVDKVIDNPIPSSTASGPITPGINQMMGSNNIVPIA